MTEQQHSITPPDELVEKWRDEALNSFPDDENPCPCDIDDARDKHIATQAARWGADQEFEGCYEAIKEAWDSADSLTLDEFLREFRSIRRPTPPSLKEQALALIDDPHSDYLDDNALATIRRAIESLPD